MHDGDGKREPRENDPAKLAQLLEIELMQKRAAWQQARASRSKIRAVSFLFLFLVVVGAALAFFLLLAPDRLNELRPAGGRATATPASPRH